MATTHHELTATQAAKNALTGDDTVHDHKPGTMNIVDQERTFAAFMTWVTRAGIVIVVVLILLALVNG